MTNIAETGLETTRELEMLEKIEYDPDVTQASLAAQLGVAVGTVNWHIKRLVAKGYVKVKRAQRRKLRYIITPEGMAFRARLTVNYIETSMRLYRRTRPTYGELLKEMRQAGSTSVRITGEGDIADICRLTCLEQNITIVDSGAGRTAAEGSGTDSLPALEVRGTKVTLRLRPSRAGLTR